MFSQTNILSHLCLPAAPKKQKIENHRDVDLVPREAPYGVMCSRLIEYFDQKPRLIYIEMIPLLVEKIRINWFPWDSRGGRNRLKLLIQGSGEMSQKLTI